MSGHRGPWAGFGLAWLMVLGLADCQEPTAAVDDRPPPLKLNGWPRKLSWDDFRVVEKPADNHSDRDAGFYSTLDVTDFEFRRTAPGVFQIRAVVISVTIDDNRWVRRGRQSDSLLAHEQGHFDITGLAAHNLSRALLRIRGDTVETLRTKGKKAISDQAAACDRWNQEYDRATNHGLDRKAQQQWADRIARAIQADYASLDDTPDEPGPAQSMPSKPTKPAPPRRKGR